MLWAFVQVFKGHNENFMQKCMFAYQMLKHLFMVL